MSNPCKLTTPRCRPICTVDGCDHECRSHSSPYCEAHYYRLRRSSPAGLTPVQTACAYCQSPLSRNMSRFCSMRCAWRHRQNCPVQRQCAHCGVFYEPNGKQITCSDVCRVGRIKEQKRAEYPRRQACSKARATMSAAHALRRQRIRNATVECFDPAEVFARDGWKCGICSRPVDRKAKWPNPNAPSLDHIVPLSRGGEHSRLNTQCSHLGCNWRKHTGAGGQLRLLP